ncbi:MAG: hypothetical protein IGS03_00320 [Candidatus Sericytochromatia bacterium]|nr:hypothetical protein [Candidatus Sericytochromatia bacterium]
MSPTRFLFFNPRRPHRSVGLCLLVVLGLCFFAPTAHAVVPEHSRQLVRILTPDWPAVSGQLQRFSRPDAWSNWEPVGAPVEIVVGRKGLGWGRGLVPAAETNGDFRREGDARAPAGVFRLGPAFGLATRTQAQQWLQLNMPYTHLHPEMRCIGDRHSRYYNELVDLRQVAPDWQNPRANENMYLDAIRDEGAYRWGVFVQHNHPDNPPGLQRDTVSGSCIFLHIWKGPGIGTSGCSAMAKTDIVDLLNWLDASQHPVLVQLPQPVYLEKQTLWRLPLLNKTP